MKKFSLLSLVLPLSLMLTAHCTGAETPPRTSTSPASAPPHTGLTIATSGEPIGLHLESSTLLSFCDKRGGRQVDLATGREAAFNRACRSNDEPNIACANLSLDVEVQSPPSQPNDILDLEGRSVRLRGRVHDCAADGKVLAVVTTSTVVLVDATHGTTKEIDRQGGDRVAIGFGWVAWSKGTQLRVAAR